MKTLQLLILSIIVCFLSSCSSDKDDTTVTAPSDFYYIGDLPISFYTNGSTGTPNINWGNEIGAFTLDNTYTGVSIDNTTGVLSWNEDLPLGSNQIDVTATNSAGNAMTSVIFLHQFSGQFNGGYNSDPTSTIVTTTNLDILFNVDGTMNVTDTGETVSGTWSFNPTGELFCEYTLISGSYELEFDLTYSIFINPNLEGFKRNAGSTTNLGYAELDYQQ